jgi:hypothetical protein
MFSLAAPFVGLGLSLVVNALFGGNRRALLIAAFFTAALILSGLVLGIVALVNNRRLNVSGVTPRAVGGVCICGFLIFMMAAGVPGLLRAMAKAPPAQTQGVASPESK